jgi:chorismate mutase/prephenate dehydratase
VAALRAFPDAELVAAPTIVGVFDVVERGDAEQGVVPIENSIGGAVSFTLDRLLETSLSLCGEIVVLIEHCLVSPLTDVSQVRRVYSHPQGLAQCRKWLAANLPDAELIPYASTAGAARDAKAESGDAAISSRLSAELLGLNILLEGIQDGDENATRFVVLGRHQPQATGHDKTSIAFSTPHERGALLKVLSVFDDEGINLTRIESRPMPDKQWQYFFSVDIEGHRTSQNVARALDRVAALHPEDGLLKVFGSYPRSDG